MGSWLKLDAFFTAIFFGCFSCEQYASITSIKANEGSKQCLSILMLCLSRLILLQNDIGGSSKVCPVTALIVVGLEHTVGRALPWIPWANVFVSGAVCSLFARSNHDEV